MNLKDSVAAVAAAAAPTDDYFYSRIYCACYFDGGVDVGDYSICY